MAGTAPTAFKCAKTLDAGPVHCSVCLCPALRLVHLFIFDHELELPALIQVSPVCESSKMAALPAICGPG
jgi:hypothetical protein